MPDHPDNGPMGPDGKPQQQPGPLKQNANPTPQTGQEWLAHALKQTEAMFQPETPAEQRSPAGLPDEEKYSQVAAFQDMVVQGAKTLYAEELYGDFLPYKKEETFLDKMSSMAGIGPEFSATYDRTYRGPLKPREETIPTFLGIPLYNKVPVAFINGAKRSVNSVSDSVFWLGRTAWYGAYKAKSMIFGNDSALDRRWNEIMSHRVATQNPLRYTMPEDRMEGAAGFLEFSTEVVGAVTTGTKVLKSLGVLIGGSSKMAHFARGVQVGAVADAVALDSYEHRLSNAITAIDALPDFVQKNDLIEWLQADKHDSELESRVKAVIEGGIFGAAVDLSLMKLGYISRLVRDGKAGKQPAQELVDKLAGLSRSEADEVRAIERGVTVEEGEDYVDVVVAPQEREVLLGRRPRRAAVKLDDGSIVILPGKGHGEELGLKTLTDEQLDRVDTQGFIEPDGTFRSGNGTVDAPNYFSKPWDDLPEELRADPELMLPKQEGISSAGTSRNQIPAGYWAARNGGILKPGGRNFDVGGGGFDKMTEQASEDGVTNLVLDPYMRDQDHNWAVANDIHKNKADTGTSFNVLNVIKTAEARIAHLRTLAHGVKKGGDVVIQVYHGGSTGTKRLPGEPTADGYQLRNLTEDYLEEVRQVFPNAEVRNLPGSGKGTVKVIVATNPYDFQLPLPRVDADVTKRPPTKQSALEAPAVAVGDQVWRLSDEHYATLYPDKYLEGKRPRHTDVAMEATKMGAEIDAAMAEEAVTFGYTTHNGSFVTDQQAQELFGFSDSAKLREDGVIGPARDPYGVADITERVLARQEAEAAADALRPRPERIPARNVQEANAMAEILREEVYRRRRSLSGAPIRVDLTAQQRDAIRQNLQAMVEDGSIGSSRAIRGVHFNVPYFETSDDVRALILSMSDEVGNIMDDMAGNSRDAERLFKENVIEPKAMEDIHRAASYLVDNNSTDDIIQYLSEVAGTAQRLPQVVLGARALFLGLGERATRVARLVDAHPDNPLFTRVFAQELDRVVSLGIALRVTETGLGRALRVLGEQVEPRLAGRGLWKREAREAVENATEKKKSGEKKKPTRKEKKAAEKAAVQEGKGVLDELTRMIERDAKVAPKLDPFDNKYTRNPVSEFLARENPTGAELRAMARGITLANGDMGMLIKGTRLFMEELSPELKALRTTASKNAVESIRKKKWWRGVLGFRTGMMLFDHGTLAVNATSTFGNAFIRPVEDVMGGSVYYGVKYFDKVQREEGALVARVGLHTITSMLNAHLVLRDIYGQAFKQMKRSMVNLESNLDAIYTKDESGWLQVRNAEDHLGIMAKISGFSMRGLLGTDTFLKELAYRSRVRAMGIEEIRRMQQEMGATFDTDSFNRFLNDYVRHSVDPEGGARVAHALAYARDVAYQTPLEHGGLGKIVDNAANQDTFSGAIVSFIFPFRRTPANLYKWPIERFPVLGMLSRNMREDISAGGQRAARAIGKQVMGTMIYGGAAYAAYNGLITGHGPRNQKLREAMMARGWKPYSVWINGEWWSYRRWDPIATPMALMADFIQGVGEFGTHANAEAGMAALVAMNIQNLASKNYMRGMHDLLDAIYSGNAASVKRYLAQSAVSFEPAFFRDVAEGTDPVVREARTIIENLAQMNPYWSNQLEPKRNWFGEVIYKPHSGLERGLNPFTRFDAVQAEEDEPLFWELVQLGRALPEPNVDERGLDFRNRDWDDSDANQSPWDRMYELLGAEHLNAERIVRQVMTSEAWTSGKLGEGTLLEPGGAKYNIIASVYEGLFRAAFAKVLEEPRYKRLKQAWVRDEMYSGAIPLLHENVFQHHIIPERRKEAYDSLRALKKDPEARYNETVERLLSGKFRPGR